MWRLAPIRQNPPVEEPFDAARNDVDPQVHRRGSIAIRTRTREPRIPAMVKMSYVFGSPRTR